MSTSITHNRATIQWTLPRIAYTPETYTVHFGTSPGSLTNISQQRQSGDSFTATNLPFSVQLTGLAARTRYYYQVVAVNSVGSTQSLVQQFTTREQRKPIFCAGNTCTLELPIHTWIGIAKLLPRVSLCAGLQMTKIGNEAELDLRP